MDMDWVKEQLTQNKTKKAVGDAVIALLETWQTIKHPPKTDILKEVLDVFSKLSLGHSLGKNEKNENWIQAQAGFIKVADLVRIRFDAFDFESKKHSLNGRQCKVVGIRYGDIIVKSNDDKSPVLDGLHLKPEHLDKLI
jgi:hypothetical protein